jgi:hypothetical protein
VLRLLNAEEADRPASSMRSLLGGLGQRRRGGAR